MPAGPLSSAFAFYVYPKQRTALTGGAVAVRSELSAALDSAFDRSKVASAPMVSFRVDPLGSRSHPVRDVAIRVAFGAGQPVDGVSALASRFATVMDNRSKPALFVVTVHALSQPDERRVILWTFPQQEVFDFSTSAGKALLEVRDAFIPESKLRKVALLEGKNTPTGMLTARILDFQAAAAERNVADLWIVKFLDAQLQMSSTEGTRILVVCR